MPHILMIATGGTIACCETAHGLSPALDSGALLGALPELSALCTVETLDLMQLDSTDVTAADRQRMAQAVWQNREKFDGFVLTHGTDTLEETAYLLDLVHNSEKPVCLTGAMRSAAEISPDGPVNLLCAVRTAGSKRTNLTQAERDERLIIYMDCNEAFRNLLLGKFGRLPLGFPEDWVYESAFGAKWREALRDRRAESPLLTLAPADLAGERVKLESLIKRPATEEEFVMYMNHPADALKTIEFRRRFGDPNALPLDVWFEGLRSGETLNFSSSDGKPHQMHILSIDPVTEEGFSTVRYVLDSEILTCAVKVKEGTGPKSTVLRAEPGNVYQVASPRKADLWIVHVVEGDIVKAGQELFNVSIMKQEKAVCAAVDGIVKRVLKRADFAQTRRMVPVEEGELIVELAPVPKRCTACGTPAFSRESLFCSVCGARLPDETKTK